MTEPIVVSIEEVRVLVAERQRYDDWLTALEARRAETPARVFDRVYGDYSARRSAVLERLHTHVDGLSAMRTQLDGRLEELETTLASLEDERVEAMLRTAVGEFDDTRWEQVRTQVEERIAQLGEERDAVLAEVDDVRALLASAAPAPEASAQTMPELEVDGDEAAASAAPVSGADALAAPEAHADAEDHAEGAVSEVADAPAAPTRSYNDMVSVSLVSDLASVATATPLGSDSVISPSEPAPTEDDAEDVSALFETGNGMASRSLPASEINLVTELPPRPTPEEIGAPPVEFDDALALFSDNSAPADPGFVKSFDGIEVEIEPPVVRTTPPTPADVTTAHPTPANAAADPFDDLAFLRSVIDPAGGTPASSAAVSGGQAQAGNARPSAGDDQQKTLRCTECGTMNLPTEWYCERCGGELAAF